MTFQDELLEELADLINKGQISFVNSSDNFFFQLTEEYPIYGSKINWNEVPEAIIETTNDLNDVSNCTRFFKKIVQMKKLSGKIIYANDSAIECALIMSVEVLANCIHKILEFPDHHYIINSGYNWCMTFTMEGDMIFGFKP